MSLYRLKHSQGAGRMFAPIVVTMFHSPKQNFAESLGRDTKAHKDECDAYFVSDHIRLPTIIYSSLHSCSLAMTSLWLEENKELFFWTRREPHSASTTGTDQPTIIRRGSPLAANDATLTGAAPHDELRI